MCARLQLCVLFFCQAWIQITSVCACDMLLKWSHQAQILHYKQTYILTCNNSHPYIAFAHFAASTQDTDFLKIGLGKVRARVWDPHLGYCVGFLTWAAWQLINSCYNFIFQWNVLMHKSPLQFTTL